MRKMDANSIIFFPILAIIFAFSACSEPKEMPLDVQADVSVHPEGWKSESSPNFHGAALAEQGFNTDACQQCHGNQFDGGIVETSCLSCHQVFPHPPGWGEEGENSHINYIKQNNYDYESCKSCHGEDFSEVKVKNSCKTCHETFPHPSGWAETGENSHSNYIQESGYIFESCKSCHGEDYSEVKIDNSCRTCHTNPEGPEACNTCHGAFAEDVNDLHNVAPPAGLNNETDPTSPAVGAHQTHLAFFEAVEATCRECHTLPESMAAAGHIDADGQADVLFQGVLALTTTEGGARVPSPAFDPATNGCENTYCHGNWGLPKSGSQNPFFFAEEKMQGNNATPVWNDPETGACGTCHDLPPKGHNPFALNECANCHLDIINREGEFIDKSVHVNGKINVFRLEYPMF